MWPPIQLSLQGSMGSYYSENNLAFGSDSHLAIFSTYQNFRFNSDLLTLVLEKIASLGNGLCLIVELKMINDGRHMSVYLYYKAACLNRLWYKIDAIIQLQL